MCGPISRKCWLVYTGRNPLFVPILVESEEQDGVFVNSWRIEWSQSMIRSWMVGYAVRKASYAWKWLCLCLIRQLGGERANGNSFRVGPPASKEERSERGKGEKSNGWRSYKGRTIRYFMQSGV